jgi:hypothetical protein|tara:strand:- start:67 stop:225 length:159 start_codon:yes stop_codon:yes gene_type:complete
MNGIVIDDMWVEERDSRKKCQRTIVWEWCVLFDDGKIAGADSRDIRMISGTR